MPELGFHSSHKLDVGEIYFIANSSNIKRSLEGTFRVSGMEPEIWDPLTGKTSDTPALRRDAKTVTLALELAPYESRVIVFSKDAKQVTRTAERRSDTAIDSARDGR